MLHNLGLRTTLWYLGGTNTPHAASRWFSAYSLLKARLFSQGRPICVSEITFPSVILLLVFFRINSTLQHVKWKNYSKLACCAIQIKSHHSNLAVAALPKGMACWWSQDLAELKRGYQVLRRKDSIVQWLGIPWDRCLASCPDQNSFLSLTRKLNTQR